MKTKGLVTLLACTALASMVRADVYVGSSNNSGMIYDYSGLGTLLGTTDPGFGGGTGALVAVQGSTGNIVASTGGFLQLLNSSLSSRSTIGSGFGAFTAIASQSDGHIVAGATVNNNSLYNWASNGGFVGAFGSGWLNSTVAIGLDNSVFSTYSTGSQYNLGKFQSDFSFVNVTASDIGSSLVTNLATGELWSAGNAAGQVLRIDANGTPIAQVGQGWGAAILASGVDGRMWLSSPLSGGLLASWSSDGTYLGIFQTGIGNVAALAVDPVIGVVYVGLTDASGGGINRYAADGTYLDTFGSNLGITSLATSVPEPSSWTLLGFGGLAVVVWRTRRGTLNA